MSEAKITREFQIRSTLTDFCGRELTPRLLDLICERINSEMADGYCAWAFKKESINMGDES